MNKKLVLHLWNGFLTLGDVSINFHSEVALQLGKLGGRLRPQTHRGLATT